MTLKDIIIISILSSILFVSEQILTFIPNVQITFLLIIVFSKIFKLRITLLIILIHVLLDNLFLASFNIMFVPFMFIGYSIIPISLYFIKVDKEVVLALLSIIFSCIYCSLYIIPNTIVFNVNILDYLIADIPFMIILSLSSFISVIWLYKPIKEKLEKIINK